MIPKPVEKMGFEEDRRLKRIYGNEPIDVVIEGRTFHFKSGIEHRWALCLELLRKSGVIDDWDYESKDCLFRFTDGKYLCDFVTYKDGVKEFYEVKGHLAQPDIRRFKLVQKYYPGTVIYLVIERIPEKHKSAKGVWKRGKRQTNLYRSALKYVERIIELKNYPV